MEEVRPKPIKVLGHKAYGSIPHLIGSRRGPGDIGVNEGQHRICTEKARDKHDVIIVQEKLDGSCVAVAKMNSTVIVPLIRAGYPATGSNYKQHHMFHEWVFQNAERFTSLLKVGERVVGEWLAQAHGTKYDLPHEPFVAFDIMHGHERITYNELRDRCWHEEVELITPWTMHKGEPMPVEVVMEMLGEHGTHGALDIAEGAVWRVERKGKVEFLAKYVRPEKGADGKYLESVTGGEPVWNWLPPRADELVREGREK